MRNTESLRKSPDEILDYTFNWIDMLSGEDVVESSTFSVDSEDITILTNPAASFTDETSTVWFSGGILHKTYRLTNTVVTEEGRELQQSVTINMIEK